MAHIAWQHLSILGMEYCGGVKNVKIGVAEVISDKIKIDNCDSIPEVSLIRSVAYIDDGIIIRKASNVGRGRLIPYANLQVTCNMKLIESFSPSNQKSNITKQDERLDRKINSFYFCPEYSCISTFKNEVDLYDHIALGQHVTADHKMTTLDIAKIQLFNKLCDVNLSLQISQPTTTSGYAITTLDATTTSSSVTTTSNYATTTSSSVTTTSNHATTTSSSVTTTSSYATTTSSYTTKKPINKSNMSKTMKFFSTQGWALKVPKPRRPIDEGVKLFIKSILNEEKLYSVKFTEQDFVRRIRAARRNDGTKMFSPHQYLTLSQVKTQIKLLSKKLSSDGTEGRKNIIQSVSVDEDEDEKQYNKTPRLNRKQISIRTSTRKSSSTQSSHPPNDHNVFNQHASDDDLDEEDEIALEQEKQIDKLKKKILTS